MRNPVLLVLASCALAPAVLHAQDPGWRPPSAQMPAMPAMAGLQDGWRSAAGPWLQGMTRVSGADAGGMRAAGESTGGGRARFVRFLSGHVPVSTWSDRNGDGTADLVELFRDGARVVQVIDPDYDGSANVLRVYSPSGELLREERP